MPEVETTQCPKHWREKKYSYEHEGQICEVYFGLREVPASWQETLWDLYSESLHIEEAVQEQSCYSRETFIFALSDPDYVKIVMVLDEIPSGLIMGTNNLEKARVAYINPGFIRERFPEEVESGRFWYTTCLFISPRVRNLGFVNLLVKALMVELWDEGDGVVAFDVSDSRLFIPDLILKLLEEEGFPGEKVFLGSQSYFALRRPSGWEPSAGE